MRICIHKATKRIIEMQGGGEVERLPRDLFKTDEEYAQYLIDCDALEVMRLNTLKQNALNAGYKEDEIEVKWITDEEWAAIQKAEKVRNYDPSIEVQAKLAGIDLKSIRSIREYIAAKPDAPAYLKTYEAQAIAERAVIIK